MKDQRKPRDSSNLLRVFQDIVTLVRSFTLLPQQIALVPAPGRRHTVPDITRRTPPAQTTIWPLLLVFVLVMTTPAWSAPPSLPAGVPNIYDPGVLEHFQLAEMGNLRDNPDFPVLLLVNTTGGTPQALLLGLDARNGTDAWSLTADPIILILLFSDQATIQGAYVDAGFVDLGRASGNYAAVGEESLPALPDMLGAVTAPVTGSGKSERLGEASATLPIAWYSSTP
jgi:hypothetical protein